jgi:hypothetical protein
MNPSTEPALAALRLTSDLLRPVDLGTVTQAAELQCRVDRKYLVSPEDYVALIEQVRSVYAILEIEGRRDFAYESVYFDTRDLHSYHQAARGRRRRFKVRTRAYLDSGLCLLEVKTVGGRGETVKERVGYDLRSRRMLTPAGHAFIQERVTLPAGCGLQPKLTTGYARSTLVDLDRGARMTCDAGLRLSNEAGRAAVMGESILVETKSPGATGTADRILWRLGNRPVAISKYCVGMAVLDPALSANKWHRTLQRHFKDALVA